MHETMARVLGGRTEFGEVGEDAREVIRVILNKQLAERPKVCEIFDSPWARRMETELNLPESRPE